MAVGDAAEPIDTGTVKKPKSKALMRKFDFKSMIGKSRKK